MAAFVEEAVDIAGAGVGLVILGLPGRLLGPAREVLDLHVGRIADDDVESIAHLGEEVAGLEELHRLVLEEVGVALPEG